MAQLTKFFHFDCYAVVSFDLGADGTAVTPESYATVRGFFISRDTAEIFVAITERERLATIRRDHENSVWRGTEPYITTVVYQIVSLSHLSLKFLGELDRKLEEAARLQAQGIGVEGKA